MGPAGILPAESQSRQPIDAHREQEHRADKRVALKERAIDSGQIAFFGFVLVNKRRRDQRQ